MALELVQKLPELIGSAVEANPASGYAAIFAAMFLENLFPPIPSELIMPLGGFYVRGGGVDQNLILLDNAIVYNASHLFGFFSVVVECLFPSFNFP